MLNFLDKLFHIVLEVVEIILIIALVIGGYYAYKMYTTPEPPIKDVVPLPAYTPPPGNLMEREPPPRVHTSSSAPHSGIIHLVLPGLTSCSAFVISKKVALTAGHCLMSFDPKERFTKETFEVWDTMGNDTGARASALWADSRRDLGAVIGDFREFTPVRYEATQFTIDLPVSKLQLEHDKYRACGFPGGQKLLICNSFRPTRLKGVFLQGYGAAFPGMSGGPVLDSKNVVIAVVVAGAPSADSLVVSPLQGARAALGIE